MTRTRPPQAVKSSPTREPRGRGSRTPAQRLDRAAVILGGLHDFVGLNLDDGRVKAEILRRLSLVIGILEGET